MFGLQGYLGVGVTGVGFRDQGRSGIARRSFAILDLMFVFAYR